MLQGLDPVPSTFLRSLGDRHLESQNLPFRLGPVELIPRIRLFMECTSSGRASLGLFSRPRHLLFPLKRLIKFSHHNEPAGSGPPFGAGHQPLSPPLQRDLCFLQPPLPPGPTAFLAVSLPFQADQGAYHVPQSPQMRDLAPTFIPTTFASVCFLSVQKQPVVYRLVQA